MVQKSTSMSFQEAWTFPEPVEKRIANFLSIHPGLWLHAPVGISKIGKGGLSSHVEIVTLDSDPTVNPDIIGDIFKLKEHSTIKSILKSRGGFDGVISDPVWLRHEICKHCKKPVTREVGLAYPDRRKLSYAVRDILKPGGWWIMNCLWDASCKGLDITPNNFCKSGIEIPRQKFNSYRNLPYLSYMQKQNGDLNAY